MSDSREKLQVRFLMAYYKVTFYPRAFLTSIIIIFPWLSSDDVCLTDRNDGVTAEETFAAVEATLAQNGAGEDTRCGVDLQETAALFGGLTTEVAKDINLFEMFTQGLLCFSGPTDA